MCSKILKITYELLRSQRFKHKNLKLLVAGKGHTVCKPGEEESQIKRMGMLIRNLKKNPLEVPRSCFVGVA